MIDKKNDYTLKVLTLISKTSNELYPGKYTVAVDSDGGLGLYYPEAKRIVSPIDFDEDPDNGALYVLFFNNCNDLMDDFIAIQDRVNAKVGMLQLLDKNKNNNSKDTSISTVKNDINTNFYVLKLGNWFISSGTQLITYPDPRLTDNLKYALMFTDDELEDDFKKAIDYYLSKGFKRCKINFKEV